jgi:hypothetical protein
VSSGATSFTFTNSLASGTSYAVTVQSSPSGQTCSVANGTGTIGSANVSNVVVTCSDQAYTIGGTVSGLNGSGLVLANGADHLTVSSGATSFTMNGQVAFSSTYQLTVLTQPTGLSCSVQNGTGTMGAANVTNIAVTCSDQPYTLGGTITGLTSTGLVLSNGTDQLPVSSGASSFTMPTKVAFSSSYSVMVATQPTGLTCTVSSGSGTMPANNVTNVAVVCSAQAYPLGGSITGLTASGLVLANGSNQVSVPANATTFTMASVAYGSNYVVTVAAQPTGLTCSVSSGTGQMGAAAVNNVVVTCSVKTSTLGGTISGLTATGLVLANGTDLAHPAANAASFTMPTPVAYGSPYLVTIKTQPAAPGLNCSVSNGSGTMPATDVTNVQVACTPNVWTWEAGAKLANDAGNYPTSAGMSGPSYIPSARNSQMSWKSSDGKFWVYGGTPDSTTPADISDVWSYDPASQNWTLVSGSSTTSTTLAANWGTMGVAASTSTPGARHAAAVWVDGSGLVWLFGGQDSAQNVYNDLWTYNTATKNWTWVGGTTTANSAAVGPPTLVPRSRVGAVTWVDQAGKFWMFGGLSIDTTGPTLVLLSDLWTFDPTTQQWTLLPGYDAAGTANPNGVYPSAPGPGQTGTPSARAKGAAWVDSTGNLWLFGGAGNDSVAADPAGGLNDLWSYNTNTNVWTWVGGSKVNTSSGGAVATYGTPGTGSTANIPGGRGGSVGWTDGTGHFWLFGGLDVAAGTQFNDLWTFDPASGKWTFVKGDQGPSTAPGQYGQLGAGVSGNQPGARYLASGWTDASGHLWLFGGSGNDSATPTPTSGNLNDLWAF